MAKLILYKTNGVVSIYKDSDKRTIVLPYHINTSEVEKIETNEQKFMWIIPPQKSYYDVCLIFSNYLRFKTYGFWYICRRLKESRNNYTTYIGRLKQISLSERQLLNIPVFPKDEKGNDIVLKEFKTWEEAKKGCVLPIITSPVETSAFIYTYCVDEAVIMMRRKG